MCLGSISKDFSVNDMKKTELNGYLNDFCVDYSTTEVNNIVDIHKYFMKKTWYRIMFNFVKQAFISLLGFVNH